MNSFDDLREALLGDEQRRLRVIEQHVLDRATFSSDVANVLADSIHIAARQSERLVAALQDPLIEVTSAAARRDTFRLSEALAPVIGPSLRRSIADTLRGFLQSIETVATHAFSLRGLLAHRIHSDRCIFPTSGL